MPNLCFYVRSFYRTKQKKTTLIWNKNFPNRSFQKTMVGTFCDTCTVTGYPCFKMDRSTLPHRPRLICITIYNSLFNAFKISWWLPVIHLHVFQFFCFLSLIYIFWLSLRGTGWAHNFVSVCSWVPETSI